MRLAFSVSPVLSGIILLLRLLSAITGPVLIIVTAKFINTAIAVFNENDSIKNLYILICLLGELTFLRQFITVINKYIRSKFLIKNNLSYRVELIEKRGRLAYRYLEDPTMYDLLKRVTDPADTQIIDQYQNFLSLVDIIIQIGGILTILVVNVWWVAPLIILFSFPAFYYGARAGKTLYETDREVSQVERKATYLTEVCSGREAALERTLYGYGDAITKELWERFDYARVQKQISRKKTEIQLVISGLLTALTAGSIMLILLQPVSTGKVSIGLFISLTTSSISLSNTLGGWLPNVLKIGRASCRERV